MLPLLVERLAPEGVETEAVYSFGEAVHRLEAEPPDALIVNLAPSGLPWADLVESCRRHRPRIPVLLESCVYSSPAEVGIGDLGDDGAFLAKPYGIEELRAAIGRLVAANQTHARSA